MNEVAPPPAGNRFRIGHPSGRLQVEVAVEMLGSTPVLTRAALVRTAGRIMEGVVEASARVASSTTSATSRSAGRSPALLKSSATPDRPVSA